MVRHLRGDPEKEKLLIKETPPSPIPFVRQTERAALRDTPAAQPGSRAQQRSPRVREEGDALSGCGGGYLVLVARPLTVLGQTFQCLVDERDVLLVYVQPKEAESTGRAPTDTVQKLQRLAHQVVVRLVVLAA